MSSQMLRPVTTLGTVLAAQAQRTAMAKTVPMPWLRALRPVQDRIFARASHNLRFRKIEVPENREPPVVDPGPSNEWESEGVALPPETQGLIRAVVGPGAGAMRIHQSDDADTFVLGYGADAVSLGSHTLFRRGRFDSHTERGLALIAHEATHVSESARPGAGWRRATTAGVQREEDMAMAREKEMLTPGIQTQSERPLPVASLAASPAPPTQAASPVVSPPESRPIAAPADRDVRGTEVNQQPPAPTFNERRQLLYEDLMSEIRTEFERGA